MGGIMPYDRMLNRNGLAYGDYGWSHFDYAAESIPDSMKLSEQAKDLIRGDLRRFEDDMLEAPQIDALVKASGATHAQVRRMVRFMLGLEEPGCEDCQKLLDSKRGADATWAPTTRHARCWFHSNWR